MPGNSRQFALEIDAEWAAMQVNLHEAVQYIGNVALNGVKEKSPVLSGQFRANWLVSIGDIDPSIQVGAGSGHALKSTTALTAYGQYEGFPVIYLQNNLPYASRLEDGSSSQAPGGVVGITVAELAAIWNGMKL